MFERGVGGYLWGVWADAFGEGGLIPLGEGVRSFDLGSLYL